MAQAAHTAPTAQQEFEKLLKLKDAEITILKEKLAAVESDIVQAQNLKTQRAKENEEVQALKIQSEGILTKAKAMIFENTKVIKNQELQLEALGQQNESLKDVVSITKDLLEIRNLEVKQLEGKIQCMEDRVKAEKTRQDLLHKKLETMIRHNGELKREYEAQLCLFNALRERYSEKELAQGVVSDLRRDVTGARAEQQQTNSESQNADASILSNEVVEGQAAAVVESLTNTAAVAEALTNTVEGLSNTDAIVESLTNTTAAVEALTNTVATVEGLTNTAAAVEALTNTAATIEGLNNTAVEALTNTAATVEGLTNIAAIAEGPTNTAAVVAGLTNTATAVEAPTNTAAANIAAVIQSKIVAESLTSTAAVSQANDVVESQTNAVIESQIKTVAKSQDDAVVDTGKDGQNQA